MDSAAELGRNPVSEHQIQSEYGGEQTGAGDGTTEPFSRGQILRLSWWSFKRGTIRVAVSLERLQANIIRATLPQSKVTMGVFRETQQDGDGDEGLQPVELFCKVLWNGKEFSSPGHWDKVFCLTQHNDQLRLDVRAPPELASPRLWISPSVSRSRLPTGSALDHHDDKNGAQTDGGSSEEYLEMREPTPSTAVETLMSPVEKVHAAVGPMAAEAAAAPATTSATIAPAMAEIAVASTPAVASTAVEAVASATTEAAVAPNMAEAGFASKAADAAVASITAATAVRATSAVAARRAAEALVPPSSAASIAAAVTRYSRSARLVNGRRRRRQQMLEQTGDADAGEYWTGDRSCVLKLGKLFHLSTFDAQGLVDALNSGEESTERMAGTKEWHKQGFRLVWDAVRRRFTILNVSRRSFVLRGGSSSLATELLGFRARDYASQPVAEALLDPQQPSDPPRRHMAVTADSMPPPLLRPHWMRVVWGPPAMEIARGGAFRVQVWARQPMEQSGRVPSRRRRRRSSLRIAGAWYREDGSWLVGTAVLDAAEVCRVATGTPTRLPLFSPRALQEADPDRPTTTNRRSSNSSGAVEAASSFCHSIGYKGLGWVPAIIARQRQRLRRLKRRIVAKGLGADKCTAIGVGGATVYWGPRSSLSGRSGRQGDAALTPSRWEGNGKHFAASPVKAKWRRVLGGDPGVETPVSGELGRAAPEKESGVVGHVWVSLKLIDPSMLVMQAIRQWNMVRDEASVQQRRAAQLEAKRLWMFMPGLSLWRVLIQLAGISLLVSYCVTLALRAYHSTSCRSTFDCKEETDPTLASLREWQTLSDNLMSALSFLDMLLHFRTAYVDSTSKIITDPKKVAVHYLRTWFVPDLWCSLPYGTMQPLVQPLLNELEEAADSVSHTSAQHAAAKALQESALKGADSPLSLFVYRLSKRLHISKINRIRGTRAFKYVDDAAMGVDVTVKQMVPVLRGRQKLLAWLGLGHEPKRRGRIRNFFFRVEATNKWGRIVLSYRPLAYVKVVGTLVRAMRVLTVAIRAVPRAARVLRVLAVFVRSYHGRRRSKDLHEASIVIQRRAGQHIALKVAGRFQANLRRRDRASSESAVACITPIASNKKINDDNNGDGNGNSDAVSISVCNDDPICGSSAPYTRASRIPTSPRSPSVESVGCWEEAKSEFSNSIVEHHGSERGSDCNSRDEPYDDSRARAPALPSALPAPHNVV